MGVIKLLLISVIALAIVFVVVIPTIGFLLKAIMGGYMYYKKVEEVKKRNEEKFNSMQR